MAGDYARFFYEGGYTMNYPQEIFSGLWPYGHCQGIAVDTKRQFIYYSFTTALMKTDLAGNLIGTVTGLLGHLGCIDFCDQDGRLYGSLEYKNDAIGRGILQRAGHAGDIQNAFYIAIFDVDKIDRKDMDACSDGVMKTVYLKEVFDDFSAPGHRHGCSGIDGMTFGKMPGEKNAPYQLFVAYGVYGDTDRQDNDYQVILRYDTRDWKQYEKPLLQENMHACGPEKPDQKLFVYTGNTTYGVQNLEYDETTGHFLMAVYKGKKPQFPNHSLYIIDGNQPAVHQPLKGFDPPMTGDCLSLLADGSESETPGFDFPHGSTGICALGDGKFYVSEHGKENDLFLSRVRLYDWETITK